MAWSDAARAAAAMIRARNRRVHANMPGFSSDRRSGRENRRFYVSGRERRRYSIVGDRRRGLPRSVRDLVV